MTAVVLRCPHCGTTRATPGECEACHEAAVRYFCANHVPGLWLESPVCSQCGARFGVTAPAPRVAAGARHPPAPAAPSRPTRPSGMPRRPPGSPDEGAPPWTPGLGDTGHMRDEVGRGELPPDAAPPFRGPNVFGCLLRLVMVALFLFVAGYFGLLMLASQLFRW